MDGESTRFTLGSGEPWYAERIMRSLYRTLCYALCVIFTILVSFSQDNALFASKAKINVF